MLGSIELTEFPHLRPVLKAARHKGQVVVVRGLEVGISPDADILPQLRVFLASNPMHPLSHLLYVAGLASREPLRGHGHLYLNPGFVAIPQSDWAARDAWVKDARMREIKWLLPDLVIHFNFDLKTLLGG